MEGYHIPGTLTSHYPGTFHPRTIPGPEIRLRKAYSEWVLWLPRLRCDKVPTAPPEGGVGTARCSAPPKSLGRSLCRLLKDER